MTYRLEIAPRAAREIDDFAERLWQFHPDTAETYKILLNEAIQDKVLEWPHTWPFFYITGAPYHGYLFEVSRRSGYWIVYNVDESTQTVNLLRFWNASQNPATFEIQV